MLLFRRKGLHALAQLACCGALLLAASSAEARKLAIKLSAPAKPVAAPVAPAKPVAVAPAPAKPVVAKPAVVVPRIARPAPVRPTPVKAAAAKPAPAKSGGTTSGGTTMVPVVTTGAKNGDAKDAPAPAPRDAFWRLRQARPVPVMQAEAPAVAAGTETARSSIPVLGSTGGAQPQAGGSAFKVMN